MLKNIFTRVCQEILIIEILKKNRIVQLKYSTVLCILQGMNYSIVRRHCEKLAAYRILCYSLICHSKSTEFCMSRIFDNCFQVIIGEFDVSMEMGLHLDSHGLGKMSSFVYYGYIGFLETKPRQRSAMANILKVYDIYTWALLAISLLLVTGTLFCLYNLENQVMLCQHSSTYTSKFLARVNCFFFQNSKLSLLQAGEIIFGAIFQEYDKTLFGARDRTSAKLYFLWTASSFFLVMGYIGNIKAILVKKEYEPRTSTLYEMVDKDMAVHVPTGFEMIFQKNSRYSTLNRRILCQARRTEGIYKVE